MLSSNKKRLIRETISYFIDTTGVSAENFIVLVQKNAMKDLSKLEYKSWLAVKCFQLLKNNDISLADCLEFRNLATQLKLEKKGMNISIIWKKEIAECIEKTNIKAYELFEISDRDSELLYLKDKKDISFFDIENLETNFYNTFDFDADNKTFFNLLPKSIQNALLYKLPIFLNLNPYLDYSKNIDSILEDMKLFGFNKKILLNIYYASLFRVIRLCEEYDLKDIRIGIFTPLDMFYEKKEYQEFYEYFKSFFVFNSGICLNPKSVGIKEKSELIGYSIWDYCPNSKSNPVVLEERIQHTDDTILKGSFRLLRGKKDSLYDWTKNTITHTGQSEVVPIYLNMQTKSDKTMQRYENVLGYQINSSNLLRSLKKVGIYSVPLGESVEITYENFYNSVASYVVRSCLVDVIDLKPVYLSKPDINIKGYKQWLANAIIYFMFSPNNMTKSYREKDLVLSNRLYPLSFIEVRKYVTDDNVINDMNMHKVENWFFIDVLENIQKDLTEVGRELFSFCKKKMIESLLGKTRENVGYKDSLVAWDASFYQIRSINKLFTSKEEERYAYLVSKLQKYLNDGIYKFGFISEIEDK